MDRKGPGAPSVDEFTHRLKEGYSLLQNNRLVEAKENLEKALELRPGNDRALNLLAMVFFKLEQYPKAVKIFKQLVKTNPSFSTLYMNLGLAYIKMGEYSSALPELQRAVEIDPQHMNAHNYLGLVYSKLGQYEEAKEEFAKANSPAMVARMDEKVRETRGAAEQVKPVEQEGYPEEISFEKPQEAYSTFDSAQGGEPPQEYAQPQGYPAQQGVSVQEEAPAQTAVAMQPPEGVEEPPLPPQETPVVKEVHPQRPEIWSLKELSRALAVSKNNVPALHLRNDRLLQVILKGGQQIFARLGGMVASEGEVSFEPAYKRFRGKETKAVFGGKEDPVMKISGEGQLLLSSSDHRLSLFNLEDEMVYLAEKTVFAFQDGILWENGRIQTEGAEDLNLVQFKGRGTVSISTREKIVSISVGARSPLIVDFNSLLGWFGKIVPQVKVDDALPSGGKGKRTVVELKGDGDVLIEEKFKA